MDALDVVKLTTLLDRSSGTPDVKIGLIDGPVAVQHPDLAGISFHEIPGQIGITCTQVNRAACLHGTFIAGMLFARRGSPAPAICPGCTLLLRPILTATNAGRGP